MDTLLKKNRWFWPWQDIKEEAWLEEMSTNGWHLRSVALLCSYTFEKGEAHKYAYRLDYMSMNKAKLEEYLQIFRDAGWEYIGELSNWRYWRKLTAEGETAEIFTDDESKIKKYQRVLFYLGFMLVLLMILGRTMFIGHPSFASLTSIIDVIYFIGRLLYAILIPLYIYIVIKLLIRINQLKKKAIL
jgi:hypothetical protein